MIEYVQNLVLCPTIKLEKGKPSWPGTKQRITYCTTSGLWHQCLLLKRAYEGFPIVVDNSQLWTMASDKWSNWMTVTLTHHETGTSAIYEKSQKCISRSNWRALEPRSADYWLNTRCSQQHLTEHAMFAATLDWTRDALSNTWLNTRCSQQHLTEHAMLSATLGREHKLKASILRLRELH